MIRDPTAWHLTPERDLEELWTIRPRPQPDEILSSWIARLAGAYGVGPLTFFGQRLPEFNVVEREIDRLEDPAMLTALSFRTGIPLERLRKTLLSTEEGYVFHAQTFGTTQWVIPLGSRGGYEFSSANGLPYCPRCLYQDPVPYFRRAWRFAFFPACAQHQLLLPDTCQNCGRYVNYYFRAMSRKPSLGEDGLLTCSHCFEDIRGFRGEDANEALVAKTKTIQLAIADGIQTGGFAVSGYGHVPSLQYLRVLRGVMGLLVSTQTPNRVVQETADVVGISRRGKSYVIKEHAKSHIEHRDSVERAELLCIADWLMGNWPDRFVDFCASFQLDASIAAGFMAHGEHGSDNRIRPPFWFEHTTAGKLATRGYAPTAAEKEDARKKLRTRLQRKEAAIEFTHYLKTGEIRLVRPQRKGRGIVIRRKHVQAR